MADLTKIEVIGPYQAEWKSTPISEKPPGCEIPADPHPPLVLEPIEPPVIPTDCTYDFPPLQPQPYMPEPVVPEFIMPPIPVAQPEAPFKFQVTVNEDGDLVVGGGVIPLGSDCSCTVLDLPPVSISVGETIMFWLQLMRPDGEEADGFDNSCCTIEIKSALWNEVIEDGPVNPADWPDYPVQPNAPFISRKLIAYSTSS